MPARICPHISVPLCKLEAYVEEEALADPTDDELADPTDDEAEAERAEQAARDMDDENFTECCQANEAQAEVAEAEAEAAAAAAAGEYARMAASATDMDL